MSKESSIMTIEEAIEQVGIGRFQYKLLAICGAGWAADAMEVLLIAFVLPAVIRDWQLTQPQAGLIGTAVFVGMLAGAWFWGTISDYIGRRLGFQLTVLVDSVFGLLSALSPSYVWLLVLRGLTGFGVGGTMPVDYAIFSEFLPRRNRGRYLVLLESFWALGTIVAAGLAWIIVPRFGWRLLLGVSAIPGLIVYFVRRYIPESPRYLLVAGREEEARRVLQQVAAENGTPLALERLRLAPVSKSGEKAGLESRAPKRRWTVSTLWRRPYARTTLMLWITWFTISLAYYGTFTWLPSIFVQRGFAFLRTYQNTFIMALAQLPGYFTAAYLVERWGRRPTLAAYLLLSGVFTYLFAVVNGLNWIVAAAVWMSFFTLGAWGALYAYTPESYPTEVRSTGLGWASGMSRIAGAIAPILGGILLTNSLAAALTLYAISFVVGAITVFTLGRETAGTPLEDTASA